MPKTTQKTNTKYVNLYPIAGRRPDYIWREPKKECIGKDKDGKNKYRTWYERRNGYYNHGLYAYEVHYTDFNGKDQYYCTLHLPLNYGQEFARRADLMERLRQVAPNIPEHVLKSIQFRPLMAIK